MILSRFLRPLLFTALLLLAAAVRAEPLVLGAGAGTTSAAGFMLRLDDPAGRLTPAQALEAEAWQALPSSLKAGFTTSYIWLRVQVRAEGESAQRWMLRLNNALVDDVRFYQRDAHGQWQAQRSGEDLERRSWPEDYRAPAFAFTLQGGASETLLLRLHTKNAMSVSVDFAPPQHFAERTRLESLGYGVYFGVYLMLIGFHVIFWRFTGAPESGWYLAYVGCCVWIEALTSGLPQQVLEMPVWLSDPLLGVGLALGLPIGVVFASRQLELARVHRRLARFLAALAWLVGGAAALAFPFGFYRDAMPVVLSLSLTLIPVFLGLAVWLWARGHRPARFYLLAFGIYYAGVAVAFLRNFGALPANLWTDHAVAWGTMLHMGVMSLRIISHYNSLKREKAHAQQQATELALQQNARLEALVAVRTRALRDELQRRERLERALRVALDREQSMRTEQSDFVAMVSHEFRTPLAIISTSAQQLARNLDAVREKSLRRCQNIRDAAARLLALVDDYLTHDRISDERPLSRFASCDLAGRLQEVAGGFPHGRIVFDPRLSLDRYCCDAGLVSVAVRNLLANADRHAPAGEAVRLSAWDDDEYVHLTVSHAGPPIAEDERGRLFNKYYRGRQAQASAGAGLGLYIVHRIAELHGGRAALTGYGGDREICFHLRLRRLPAAARLETAAAPA